MKPHYNRPKPVTDRPEADQTGLNRPKPDWNIQNYDQNHYYYVKPSYHESTTQLPDFYPDIGSNNPDGDDDYVPVHTNGHKPPRPSYPGEMCFIKSDNFRLKKTQEFNCLFL